MNNGMKTSNCSFIYIFTRMKLFLQISLLIAIVGYCQRISSQTWQHIYFSSQSSCPFSVIEGIDKGYIIAGHYYNESGFPTFGYILKTDINGNSLWDMHIGSTNYATSVYDLKQTSDGGYIFTGAKMSNDPLGDTYVAKVDRCLNIEWCKHFVSNNNQFDFGRSIYEVSGGYIVLVPQFGDDIVNKRIWLFRLDPFGDIIWQQVYCQTDTLIKYENGEELVITPNNHYLITAYCYYPDSGSITLGHLRPLIIDVDSSGNACWELAWSKINGETYQGQTYESIVDNLGRIYSCGRHIEPDGPHPGDKPSVIITDSNGNELKYKNLIVDSFIAIASTINWFMDSTIAIGCGWTVQGGPHLEGVIKIDTNGNIIKIKEMFESIWSFQDATTTFDNKLLIVAGLFDNPPNSYAWKLNSDLEYDTLYTQPFTYDSLCPHPITSDTIPLDCVIVGLDEPFQSPETGRLKVYPNPAWDILHIEIPEHLKTETSNPAFQITTIYHQWKSAMIEVYDLYGREMFAKDIRQADEEFLIDVSRWNAGMYVIRLVYQGQTIASEKVMVN